MHFPLLVKALDDKNVQLLTDNYLMEKRKHVGQKKQKVGETSENFW